MMNLKQFQFLDSQKPNRILFKKYRSKDNHNFDSTQQSDKISKNYQYYEKFSLVSSQKNQLKSKQVWRSAISSKIKSNQKFPYYRQDKKQQRKYIQNEKGFAKIQIQNKKLKLENEKLNLQIHLLKNKVCTLQKFKNYFKQAQLQIQFLKKKVKHYQNDIAYYQKFMLQLNQNSKKSLKQATLQLDTETLKSDICSSLKCDFTFLRKSQFSNQVQTSFSINYCLVHQQPQKPSKQTSRRLDNVLNQSLVSQGSQQIFSTIKYNEQIVFGNQIFQDILS